MAAAAVLVGPDADRAALERVGEDARTLPFADRATPGRCLVTGASGFIGSHLARVLARRGWKVTALLRATSDPAPLEGLAIERATGDVLDEDSVLRALRGQDFVFHCAGLTKSTRPGDLDRVNGEGTRKLLSAVKRAAAADPAGGPRRVIVLSSQAAAGPTLPDGRARRESDPPQPVSAYGRSKLLGENACDECGASVPWTILRPTAVYGPWEKDFATIFRALAKLPVLAEAGARPVVFCAIHSLDVVEAMIAATMAPEEKVVGKKLFIGHPHAWASDEFGRHIGRAVGRERLAVVRIPWWVARIAASAAELAAKVGGKAGPLSHDKLDEMAQGSWICDMAATESALGWRARLDAPEGLAATGAWQMDHGWIPKREAVFRG